MVVIGGIIMWFSKKEKKKKLSVQIISKQILKQTREQEWVVSVHRLSRPIPPAKHSVKGFHGKIF
jgi:hypothetical protein